MKGLEIKEKIRKFLKDAGNQVLAESVYCSKRISDSEEDKSTGCINCESATGCRKFAEFALLLSYVRSHGEDTDDFKEFYREMVRAILRGNGFLKSVEEYFDQENSNGGE